MMDSTAQAISFFIVLIALVTNVVVRRNRFPQRDIPALSALPVMAGTSIETNKPLHMSFGDAAVGDRDTLLALASADFFYASARAVALGETAPIVTVGSATTLQVARDMLRRAHTDSQAAAEFRPFNVRWIPGAGYALAAMTSAMTRDDRLSGHLIAGNYGPEIALPLWSGEQSGVLTLATSTRLAGQAVAYALADHTLIGEEIFAAGGYVTDDPGLSNRVLVMDLARWLLIAALFIGAVVSFARGA